MRPSRSGSFLKAIFQIPFCSEALLLPHWLLILFTWLFPLSLFLYPLFLVCLFCYSFLPPFFCPYPLSQICTNLPSPSSQSFSLPFNHTFHFFHFSFNSHFSLSLTHFYSLHSPQPSLPVLCNSLASLLAPSVMTMKGTMPAAQPKPRCCHSGHWTEHGGICVVQKNGATWQKKNTHTHSQVVVDTQECVCICACISEQSTVFVYPPPPHTHIHINNISN